MWPSETNWKIQLFKKRNGCRTYVIRSIVEDNQSVFSPVDSVLIQPTSQTSLQHHDSSPSRMPSATDKRPPSFHETPARGYILRHQQDTTADTVSILRLGLAWAASCAPSRPQLLYPPLHKLTVPYHRTWTDTYLTLLGKRFLFDLLGTLVTNPLLDTPLLIPGPADTLMLQLPLILLHTCYS